MADQPATPPGDPPAPDPADAPATEAGRFHTVLCLEGTWSGDKRFIQADALEWRDFPLPLQGQIDTQPEHLEAINIGHLDRIERIGNEIHGWGVWSTTPEAAVIRQQVRDGHVVGVSADMDDVEYEVLLPAGSMDGMMLLADASAGDTTPPDGDVLFTSEEDPQLNVLHARVIGATVTPFPAFAECFIEDLDPLGALTAAATPVHHTDTDTVDDYVEADNLANLPDPIDVDLVGAVFSAYDDTTEVNGQVPLSACEGPHHEVAPDGTPGAAVLPQCEKLINALDPADPDDADEYKHLAAHFDDAGVAAPPMPGADPAPPPDPTAPPGQAAASLVAAGTWARPPVRPPLAWFANPKFRQYTPPTVTDDGRIFGHLAEANVCHVSQPGCVTAPHSPSNYAYFHVGEVATAEGTRVAVGHIMLEGGHASTALDARRAQSFYDDTRSCVADVVVGEDRYGIWCAGALRPQVTPAQVRTLMASPLSGDWRPIRGVREMIAVAAVNSPGFNSPRPRIREVNGLVASITIPFGTTFRRGDPVSTAADRIAASIGRSTEQRRAALHARIHPRSEHAV